MKCPRCGTNNGKTNKFCRECGAKLEGLAEVVEEQIVPLPVQPLDDLALGEELFSIMRIYEDGDLAAAADRINRVIQACPESASAHSIKALILERMAHVEAMEGNTAISHGYLEQAVAEYEAIIDLNPDSTADREKLVALRMKIAGAPAAQPSQKVPVIAAGKPLDRVKERLLALPPQVLAAGLAFVVLATVGTVVIIRGNASRTDDKAKPPATAAAPTQSNQVAYGQSSYPAPSYPGVATSSYPAQPSMASAPPMQALQPVPQLGTQPIPSSPSIGLEVAALSKADRPGVVAPVPTLPPAPTPTPTPTPAPVTPPPTNRGSSDTPATSVSAAVELQNDAIRLGDAGQYGQAITKGKQAVDAFQADIDAGRNPSAAKWGIRNMNKYIADWQSRL